MVKFFLILISIISLTTQSVRAENAYIEKIGPTLKNPWGMDFINDSELLVTEKRGRIYRINISNGSSYEVENVPEVVSQGQGGLLDIIFHDGLVFYLSLIHI